MVVEGGGGVVAGERGEGEAGGGAVEGGRRGVDGVEEEVAAVLVCKKSQENFVWAIIIGLVQIFGSRLVRFSN